MGARHDRRPGHSLIALYVELTDRIIPARGFARSGTGKPPDVTAGALNPVRGGAHRQRSAQFASVYQRIARRRGKKIVVIAVARKLLTRAYHLLVDAQAHATTA